MVVVHATIATFFPMRHILYKCYIFHGTLRPRAMLRSPPPPWICSGCVKISTWTSNVVPGKARFVTVVDDFISWCLKHLSKVAESVFHVCSWSQSYLMILFLRGTEPVLKTWSVLKYFEKGTLFFLPDLKRTILPWEFFPQTSVFVFLQIND